MRVLIVGTTQYIAFHGQAMFMLHLAEGLAKHGHEVTALVNSEKGTPYTAEIRGVHIEAVRSLGLGFIHPDVYVSFLYGRQAKGVIQKYKPDIIHIQDHYPLCWSVVHYARKMGIKVIGTNHFMPENLAPYLPIVSKVKPLFNWVLWQWMLNVYNRLDAAAAPSRTAARMVKNQGLKPSVLPISCGVDTQLFSPRPNVDRLRMRAKYGLDPNKIIVFFVGRVDREKKLDVLIRAIHLMKRGDVQLVIGGNGAVRGALMSLCNELGLGERVHFTGFIPNEDLPDLLNSIDIFAMPSEAELLSISTLEAMACARPILAASAVALPELVTDDLNGFLFPLGDAQEAAKCLLYLLDHPEKWASMGLASLSKAQDHSLEKIVHRYEDYYASILAGNPIIDPSIESGSKK